MNFSHDLLMAEKIEKAKLKAEAEYKSKQEKASKCNLSVEDILTPEQLDKILSDKNFFNGSVGGLSPIEKYNKVKYGALWLDAHSMSVQDIQIENASSARPSPAIIMTVNSLSSFAGKEAKVFSMMCVMCDNMLMSSIKDDVIRITFVVNGFLQE